MRLINTIKKALKLEKEVEEGKLDMNAPIMIDLNKLWSEAQITRKEMNKR